MFNKNLDSLRMMYILLHGVLFTAYLKKKTYFQKLNCMKTKKDFISQIIENKRWQVTDHVFSGISE